MAVDGVDIEVERRVLVVASPGLFGAMGMDRSRFVSGGRVQELESNGWGGERVDYRRVRNDAALPYDHLGLGEFWLAW